MKHQQMDPKQAKTMIVGGCIIITLIVLTMFAISLLHLNRYWLCASPKYNMPLLCLYDFPLER